MICRLSDDTEGRPLAEIRDSAWVVKKQTLDHHTYDTSFCIIIFYTYTYLYLYLYLYLMTYTYT